MTGPVSHIRLNDRVAAQGDAFGAILARRHLPALDGLRALAVGVVMVYHFGLSGVPGDLGVSGFFVLSGFLITWLLIQEHDATGAVSLSGFYARRTLRIFPAYYVFITLSLLADRVMGQHWPPGMTGSAYAYVLNYYNAFHGHPDSSIAHAWSLAIEEQFYLLWPVTFLVLARGGRRRLLTGLFAIIAVVAIWRSYLYLVRGVGTAYVYDALDTRFDNLAVGCALAVGLGSAAFRQRIEALARAPLAPVVTIALLIVSRSFAPRSYHYSAGFTVDAILVAILIVQLLVQHGSRLWSWMGHPAVRYLGRISYPLYLYHIWGASVGRHLSSGGAGEFIASIVASVALASASFYGIERPFLRFKRHFEPVRTSAGTATPAPTNPV